jgi:hypothetical protein
MEADQLGAQGWDGHPGVACGLECAFRREGIEASPQHDVG